MPVLKSPGFSSATSVYEISQAGDVANHGAQSQCWELDAMDPNDLRDCVERAIKELIEPVAWAGPADPDGLERTP
jgi:hypothetical protein